jgi:N utilization substance protein B
MNARRAARELALLALFQMDSAPDSGGLSLPRPSVRDLLLASVRALSGEAEFQIQAAADQLADVNRSLLHYEAEHPDNLATPLGAPVKPVPIPNTREMVEKIEKCLQSAEWLFEALRLPELLALARQEDVQAYAGRLFELVREHRDALDEFLNRHMADWRMDRLIKMDAFILRLAVAEMRYVPDVDLSVSASEAVDLAKQFSGEESFRLINGILGSVAEEVSVETGKSLVNIHKAASYIAPSS